VARNTLIEAANAMCALDGVTPKKMVIVGSDVIIQLGRDRYRRLHFDSLYSCWKYERATFVSVTEMNALVASGALNDLLPAPEVPKQIGEKSEGKRWWK
jgi:hypothetical protein